MKYIDAERLKTEVERLKDKYPSWQLKLAMDDLSDFITSLQQEQPMPDSTQLIEFWHEDKEMLKEKDFRDDAWRLAYNAFMRGFGRGIAVRKQEQPEATCKTCGFHENNCPFIRGKLIPYPNKVCNDYTYSAMKEQEQSEVDLEKEIRNYNVPFNDWERLTYNTLEAIARHFYELGKNAKKEE